MSRCPSKRGRRDETRAFLGYTGPTVDLPVDLVKEVEDLVFDSVWTAEAYGSDAVTPLAYLAAVTHRIKLGTGILQIPARTPANWR